MEVPNLLRPSRNVTLWVDRGAGGVWLVLLLVGKGATVAKKTKQNKSDCLSVLHIHAVRDIWQNPAPF